MGGAAFKATRGGAARPSERDTVGDAETIVPKKVEERLKVHFFFGVTQQKTISLLVPGPPSFGRIV
jgi:hypothetical protein